LDGLANDAPAWPTGALKPCATAPTNCAIRPLHARDATRGYIQQEPLKAVLIAAATGAALVALGTLLSHRGHR
jgi:ElaB/YqjD/DUF883 family membrane-anchored ribosome-binding protein